MALAPRSPASARASGQPPPAIYLLAALAGLLAALACALAAPLHPGLALTPWLLALLAFAGSGFTSVILSYYDFTRLRLPNRQLLLLHLVALLPLILATLFSGQWQRLAVALALAALSGGTLFILWWIAACRGGTALGAGDVKLGLVLGFLPGWCAAGDFAAAVVALCLAVGVACIAGVAGALFHGVRLRRSAPLAFGPVLLAAMWGASFYLLWLG